MKHIKLIAAGLTGLTMLVSSAVVAKTKWDYSTEYSPTSLIGKTAAKFAEYTKELTNGDMQITIHYNGSLGFKSPDNYSAIEDGALQIADTPFNRMNGILPVFDLQSLPFLQSTFSQAAALDELMRPIYNNFMRKNNQFLLFTMPWTPQGFWAKKPILTSDDLKGLRIRVADLAAVQTMKNAGAEAVQANWGDTITGITTGAISGVLTAGDTGVSGKLPEAGLKTFTPIGFTIGVEMVHVNKDAYDKLTENNQIALLLAARKAQAYGWALAEKTATDIIDNADKLGISVASDIDPAFRDDLKKAAAPAIENWKTRFGTEGQAIIETYESLIN